MLQPIQARDPDRGFLAFRLFLAVMDCRPRPAWADRHVGSSLSTMIGAAHTIRPTRGGERIRAFLALVDHEPVLPLSAWGLSGANLCQFVINTRP